MNKGKFNKAVILNSSAVKLGLDKILLEIVESTIKIEKYSIMTNIDQNPP